MVNMNYRVDLVIIESTQAEVTKMQAKLNQWITKGELIKFETQAIGDKILFKILRPKIEE